LSADTCFDTHHDENIENDSRSGKLTVVEYRHPLDKMGNTMVQSNMQKKRGKADVKPKKPYKDCPLMFHASGRLPKRMRQKFYYLGRRDTVQDGKLTPVGR
jgi:hypothetical protein